MNKTGIALKCLFFLLCYFVSITSYQAAAGEVPIDSAQYRCSKSEKSFTILPRDKGSDPLHEGFREVQDGISTVTCRLGKRLVEVQFDITPPQGYGRCMAQGRADVTSIIVGGVELRVNMAAPTLDWECFPESDLVEKITVRDKGPYVTLEICRADEDSDGTRLKTVCRSKKVDIDALLSASAKEDHQLADPKIQEQESAKRLPPEDDLAQAFPGHYPVESNVPLCAHWGGTDSIGWNGFIAGKPGEKVYLHQTNPQLCFDANGDGCKPHAYVIPGDRVSVDFICGTWTRVRYSPPLRFHPITEGWVETSRLYRVSTVTPRRSANEYASRAPSTVARVDPLVIAVQRQDTGKIKRLISSGESPDGSDRFGAPMLSAVRREPPSMVQLLLDLGANPNASNPKSGDNCALIGLAADKPPIFEMLVKAGLNVDCPSAGMGQTELTAAAYYSRLFWWVYASEGKGERPYRNTNGDSAEIVKRLLAAGANPNAVDMNGRSALFFAPIANNVDIVELLLDAGANPNLALENGEATRGGSGDTPLMCAVHFYAHSDRFDPSLVKLLLERGANPNHRSAPIHDGEYENTTEENTVLTFAASNGYYGLVKLLLEHGADPKIPRADGLFADEIAEQSGFPEIAKLLRSQTTH